MVPSQLSNCENDVDKFLCSLEHVKEAAEPLPAAESQPPSALDSLPFEVRSILSVCTVPADSVPVGLTIQESNVLAYIAGYIVRKLSGKVCESCSFKLKGAHNEENEHHKLISEKSYGGLMYPSTQLMGTVQALEIKYREVIETHIHSNCVKAQIAVDLGKVEQVANVNCEVCHLHLLIVHLFVNIRVHHTIKLINGSLGDDKSRKNRKTVKFSHL